MVVQDLPQSDEAVDMTTQDPSDDTTQLADAATEASDWPTIDGKAAWANENVAYLFDPESRELVGANVHVWYNDSIPSHSRQYSAEIRRDGDADTWSWHADGVFLGNHTPGIARVVGGALDHGRMKVLQGIT